MWKLDDFFQEDPGKDLDSLSGRQEWKEFLRGCGADEELKEMFLLPAAVLLLFCGKAGAGKTVMANAFASELMGQGYRFLVLYGDELEGKDETETRERISGLFKRIQEEKTVLLLEELDGLKSPEAVRLLSRGLQRMSQRKLPFVCLGTAMEEQSVIPKLLACFQICRLEDPGGQERAAYFQEEICAIFSCELGLDSKRMSELTEGFSYGQLDDTAFRVRSLLCGKGKTQYGDSKVLESMKDSLVVTEELFSHCVLLVRDCECAEKERRKMTVRDTEPMVADFASQEKRSIDKAKQREYSGGSAVHGDIPMNASIEEVLDMLVSPDEI